MKDYLAWIDTHTLGNRCDVTPLFANPEAFTNLVDDLVEPFKTMEFEYVAGIDALGFILGTAVALRLHKGFIPVRKAGKLPVAVVQAEFIDYSAQKKALELRADILKPGEKVLVVDEWLETGAQVQAAAALIEGVGGVIIGIAAINIDDSMITRQLRQKYFCHSLWRDMDEV